MDNTEAITAVSLKTETVPNVEQLLDDFRDASRDYLDAMEHFHGHPLEKRRLDEATALYTAARQALLDAVKEQAEKQWSLGFDAGYQSAADEAHGAGSGNGGDTPTIPMSSCCVASLPSMRRSGYYRREKMKDSICGYSWGECGPDEFDSRITCMHVCYAQKDHDHPHTCSVCKVVESSPPPPLNPEAVPNAKPTLPLVEVEGLLERLSHHATTCQGCTNDYHDLTARFEQAKRTAVELQKARKVSAAFLRLEITI